MFLSRRNQVLRTVVSSNLRLPCQADFRRHISSVVVSDEVREAVAAKQPVVALESTIYTHGLPYPENLELASHLSATVRKNGAIAATCAVIDGVARVGLEERALRKLIETKGARKVSRRDLAYVTSKRGAGQGLNGGTTISGTMILAHLAGIHVRDCNLKRVTIAHQDQGIRNRWLRRCPSWRRKQPRYLGGLD